MPAVTVDQRSNKDRGHGPLLRREKPGQRALCRGRVSLANHAYLLTSATIGRQCFFADFYAGCAAARCFEDSTILGDARMLAWVLMPDHALRSDEDLRAVARYVIANPVRAGLAQRVGGYPFWDAVWIRIIAGMARSYSLRIQCLLSCTFTLTCRCESLSCC